ncbi:YjfB family protein [Eubacteriaceae bacterium ES2]|nr:YjfB family protein [Eubacteriaceae bacterium ES2]
MDIAALSMGMSQIEFAQQASLSVMKMAMNTGETQMTEIIDMMQENMSSGVNYPPDPNVGQLLDISV